MAIIKYLTKKQLKERFILVFQSRETGSIVTGKAWQACGMAAGAESQLITFSCTHRKNPRRRREVGGRGKERAGEDRRGKVRRGKRRVGGRDPS